VSTYGRFSGVHRGPSGILDKETLSGIEGDNIQSAFRIGGLDGLDIVRDFFKWYAWLKMPKPDAVINLSSFLGQSAIERAIASYGLREVSRKTTPGIALRRIFSEDKISKLSPAEAQDRLLNPDGHGWWTKSLLTIRLVNR